MAQPYIYHGWIVVNREEGYRDSFSVEWNDEQGKRHTQLIGNSAAQAVEWWDKKVGERILLQQLPVGAYRVYTHNPEYDYTGKEPE